MTPASSKSGWRQSRCAASAPAKPVAPATSTRGALPRRSAGPGVAQPRSSPPSAAIAATIRSRSGRDVLVGERAARPSGTTAPAPASAALADLLARRRRRTRRTSSSVSPPGAARTRSSSSAARPRSGSDDRDVPAQRREGARRRGRRSPPGPPRRARRGRRANAAVRPRSQARGDERVQLADEARSRPRRRASIARAAAGMQERPALAGSTLSVTWSVSSSASSSALAAKKSRWLAPRRARSAAPAAPLSSAPSAWCSSATAAAARGAVDGARLEDRDVRPVAGGVVARRRRAASRAASGAGSTGSSESGFSSLDDVGAARGPRAAAGGRAAAGSAKLQPTISCRPRPDERVLGARGARAGRASGARPRRGARAASPAGARRPSMRATSSIRSTSRVTSSRRTAGTRDQQPVLGRLGRRSPAPRGSRAWRSGGHLHAEDRPHPVARAGAIGAGGRATPPTSIVPGATAAPHSSIISRVATAWAVHALLRREPLLEARGGLAAQPERPRGCGGCSGRSRSRPRAAPCVVCGCDLRARAAHQAGDRGRPVGVLDQDHLAVERAGLPVERLHLLALGARGGPSAGRPPRGRGRRRAAAGPVSSIA